MGKSTFKGSSGSYLGIRKSEKNRPKVAKNARGKSKVSILFTLPNELLLEIAECLPMLQDINSFLLVNRFFYQLLMPVILRRAAFHRTSRPIGEQENSKYRSVIHWAASNGNCDLLQKLISYHKGDGIINALNEPDLFDLTPLSSAVLGKHTIAVKLLLQHGADPNPSGQLLLHYGISEGLHDILQLLLQAGADTESTGPKTSLKPLHLAAKLDDPVSVRLLAQAGADLKAKLLNLTPIALAYILKCNAALQALADVGVWVWGLREMEVELWARDHELLRLGLLLNFKLTIPLLEPFVTLQYWDILD